MIILPELMVKASTEGWTLDGVRDVARLRIGFFNSAANELADRGVLTFGQILELLPHGLIKKNVGADV